ncbi:MAG: IS630 family transposase [Gemmatimonadales bacterium]
MATERDETERAAWRKQIADFDPTRFVFVDESSANITLTPRYGRAPKGVRAQGAAPRNYRHNTTLVAALTQAGLQAPMTLAGPLDGDAFASYVQQVLVPTLQPGQIVILDNLSVHKRADIRARIERAGAMLLFLPAYSPDFTPIEQAFSKLKTVLRRIQARTQDALESAIAEALATISATDAVHWFRHAGYHFNGQLL